MSPFFEALGLFFRFLEMIITYMRDSEIRDSFRSLKEAKTKEERMNALEKVSKVINR